jgi:hypothetical protein
MSLPFSIRVKRRYISHEEQQHQERVKHEKELRANQWLQRAHSKLKPLSADYYAQTMGESGFSGRNPKDAIKALEIQGEQRTAQVNYNRLRAIEWYEAHKEYDKAAELRQVHEGQLILQKEWRMIL